MENSEKSEKSTIGYNCFNVQQLSVLESLNYRKTIQIMKDHIQIFQIAQRAPFLMSLMIKQYQKNRQEIQHEFAGSGGYGQVFYAEHTFGIPCVVKVQKIDNFEEFIQQLNEYKIQKVLNKIFPMNFVQLIDKVIILQENINTFTSYAGLEIALTTLDLYSNQVKQNMKNFKAFIIKF
ncbi:unnamed protein product [Paramecium primaurelia]|uniref:Protein kinase domain-containing protein n=1 Tax=Paramecium primaurelia TaxID=5886 RepID=A0A8S1QP12_PARPR|nr:unnamed protein product [Paramecium primaurelia]